MAKSPHARTVVLQSQGPKTVFVLGSGIADNAWVPVREALRATFPNRTIPDSTEGMNFLMANHVYKMRYTHLPDSRESDAARELRGIDKRLKEKLSYYLDKAVKRDRIKLRSWAMGLLQDQELQPFRIITTNWDPSLRKLGVGSDRNRTLLHLHGDTENPSALYLPSETINEGWRTEAGRLEMTLRAGQAIRDLKNAQTIVVAGCSVSALDVELGMLLGLGLSRRTHPCDLRIVDRTEKTCAGVLERIELCLETKKGIKDILYWPTEETQDASQSASL